jgi:hypothetical protein
MPFMTPLICSYVRSVPESIPDILSRINLFLPPA